MRKIIFIFLFFVAQYSFSQKEIILNTDKPENVGMSSDSLNKIKSVMQKYVDENKLPGMITMVARHGKVVHFEKYGWMDVGKPMQLNAIFRIASMTKPITSVALMMLYEEGDFQLDDLVAKYIPEFKNMKVFSSQDTNGMLVVDQIKPMTIRNLLTHTSGLSGVGENTPIDSLYRSANLSEGTLENMIQKLSKIPLLYQPGIRWNYSRSTDVLGYLVEVISGKPFDVFLKERIFIPLKMEDTDFYVPKEKEERVAAVYAPADSIGIKIIVPDTSDISIPVKFISGNGGLYSTVSDYMIFSQMLLNKGEYNGVRLLESKTVDLMTSNQISKKILMPDDDFFGPLLTGMGFGFGFAIFQESIPSNKIGSKGSYWWSGSANTYFYIDPKEDLIFILMTQFVPNFYYPVFKEFKTIGYHAMVD